MRGLDPRIHHPKMRFARWIAGSSPAMTTLQMARIGANLIHISNSNEDASPHPRSTMCPSFA